MIICELISAIGAQSSGRSSSAGQSAFSALPAENDSQVALAPGGAAPEIKFTNSLLTFY
jgi:hypothetical protein